MKPPYVLMPPPRVGEYSQDGSTMEEIDAAVLAYGYELEQFLAVVHRYMRVVSSTLQPCASVERRGQARQAVADLRLAATHLSQLGMDLLMLIDEGEVRTPSE